MFAFGEKGSMLKRVSLQTETQQNPNAMHWLALSMFAESCITKLSVSAGSCIPSVVTNSLATHPTGRVPGLQERQKKGDS